MEYEMGVVASTEAGLRDPKRAQFIRKLTVLSGKIKLPATVQALSRILAVLHENLDSDDQTWIQQASEIWEANKDHFRIIPAASPFPRDEDDSPDDYNTISRIMNRLLQDQTPEEPKGCNII